MAPSVAGSGGEPHSEKRPKCRSGIIDHALVVRRNDRAHQDHRLHQVAERGSHSGTDSPAIE